jgi:sensor histidine kinase YesM
MLNVDKRIKLFFGEQYGMSWTSIKGDGTVVTLLLPRRSGSPG